MDLLLRLNNFAVFVVIKWSVVFFGNQCYCLCFLFLFLVCKTVCGCCCCCTFTDLVCWQYKLQCYFVSAIVLLYWGGLPNANSVISLHPLISWGSVLVLCQVVPAHQSLPRRSLCGWSVCQNSWVTPATSSSPPSSSSTCSLDHPSTWPPSSGLRWELSWGGGGGDNT